MQHYSIRETARLLGISTRTVHRRLRDGTLHGRRIGRLWHIPASELEPPDDRATMPFPRRA